MCSTYRTDRRGAAGALTVNLTDVYSVAHLDTPAERRAQSKSIRAMEQTLLLNASYEPLKIVHWQKAVTLWCQGKVEVISCVRPGDSGRFDQLQAALGHPPAALHQDQAAVRLRAVFAREYLRARRPPVPVLRRRVPDQRAHVRSCRAGRAGRPQGLGEHRHVLRPLQPQEGRAHAARGEDAPPAGPQRPVSAPAIRITVGLRNAPDSWRDYLYWNAELDDT